MTGPEYPLLCIARTCRPADKGGPRRTNQAFVCDECTERLREDLRFIADSWDDLEVQLGAGQSVQFEQGKQTNGLKATGLVINERASQARRDATETVWFVARALLDLADREDRVARFPDDQTTPTLARWIADWQAHRLVRGLIGRTTAQSIVEDTRAAAKAVRSAAYPTGAHKVDVGLPCEQHGTSESGERVRCVGIMTAIVGTGVMPDLVCSVDESHRLEPQVWEREGWKRLHRAALNPLGVAALARKITAI